MSQTADFSKYRYFYDGSIVRINKETKVVERLYKDGFKQIHPKRSYDSRLQDEHDELSELKATSTRDLDLLQRELNKSR
mgnify:CR=1 FL=1